MATTFTLAHLSDVHLAPLPRVPLRHLNAKRLLGLLNWHKNRKGVHLSATLARIVADLLAQAPDHIAVTGDLANIGLPEEYIAAQQWLRLLGSAERVTVVPGNHDIYTRLRDDPGVERWREHMTANAAGAALGLGSEGGFPFVRRFGRIALIGLCSAVPTRPFYAGGRLGAGQRCQLARLLGRLGEEGLLRIVLIHHPPLPGQASRSKRLEDAVELASILDQHGAELVLHGHNHRSMLELRCRPGAAIPIIGVPSASLGGRHKHDALARYHLFRIPTGGPAATIELIARGLVEPEGVVVEIERRLLPGAQAAHA